MMNETPKPQAVARLRAWQKRNGLTLRELAAAIDLHQTTLSEILAGRALPGLRVAFRIEERTGVRVRLWVK